MAILEVPELKQDVERARAARRRSQEDILRIRSEIRRLEAISHQAQITYGRLASVNEQSPNLVAQQEIDLAQAQSEAAAADLAARQSALQAAQQQLAEAQANEDRASTLAAYANNSAPFDEVVTKRYANIGSMVPQGTQSNQQAMAVVKLTQIDPLRLVFPVPESIIPCVQVGSLVQVRVPALSKTFESKIWRYTGKAEDATRTMETQLLVPNKNSELKPGMLASLLFTLEQRKNALAVPLQAVSSSEGRSTVLVVNKENKINERTVALGLQTAKKYEVTYGLAEGELVVVAGRSEFQTGQTVVPKLLPFNHAPE